VYVNEFKIRDDTDNILTTYIFIFIRQMTANRVRKNNETRNVTYK